MGPLADLADANVAADLSDWPIFFTSSVFYF